MSDIGLGKIITGPQSRDAVHVAVAPVTASERLSPGQPVVFCQSGDAENVKALVGGEGIEWVGIVDPFLRSTVFPGQRFWMWLTPGSITSLRHDWTHPAFGPVPASVSPENRASEAWIRSYASQIGATFDELIDHAKSYVAFGDYWVQGGRWEGFSLDDDFWPHFENVTGLKVEEDRRGSFFSCSC